MRCKAGKSVACGKGRLGIVWFSQHAHSSSAQSPNDSGSGHARCWLNHGTTLQSWKGNYRTVDSVSAQIPTEINTERNAFPLGWDKERVAKVLEHYETQTEEEAVAGDEAAFELSGQTFIEVPTELVPAVRELLAKHKAEKRLTIE